MDASKFKGMRFYTEEETDSIADELEKAVTIPVNAEIGVEHRVYDMSEMKEILLDADRISVHDCGCKTAYDNCDAPRDVCVGINKTADELIADGKTNSKEITVEEAMKVLQRSHEAGLVHMAYSMEGDTKPGLICSCCACCCHTLGSLVRNRLHTQILTSKYIAIDDSEKCTDCGICVDRCAFQSRQMVDGRLAYDDTLCFGCGVCISTCPTNAISLVDRNSRA